MDIDKLIYDCIGASMQVYNHLGPGLLETIYEKALTYELTERGFKVYTQVNIDIKYKGVVLDTDLRLDLIVEDTLIIELKSVEKLAPVHFKQLRTYMKLLDKPAGLLINFNVADFNTGFKVLKRENTCDTLGQ
jgi:GxxExxY protein